MLSIDTNILFHAFNEDSPSHDRALAWLTSIAGDEDVAISELATVNVKDFEGLGFRKVWNPLEGQSA